MPLKTNALSVGPTTIELSGDRGQTLNSSIKVINTQASEQKYFLDVLGVQATDETGVPSFFTPDMFDSDLPNWIVFESGEFIVPAVSQVEVPFSVAIPTDVRSGSYFAAITVSPAPSDVVASNGAIIEAKTAVLIFLTIGGDNDERLAILDFTSGEVQLVSGLPPNGYHFRLQNQGNVHLTPVGSIILRGLFGNTIANMDANPSAGRVLPKSTRSFDLTLTDLPVGWSETISYQLSKFAFGPITAELNLSYGSDVSMYAEQTFWIVPWQLLATMAALLVAILLVAMLISRRKHS